MRLQPMTDLPQSLVFLVGIPPIKHGIERGISWGNTETFRSDRT